MPSIRGFVLGADAGLATGNFDFAVTADFDDEAGFFAYRDDPAHREVIARTIAPITAQRVAVQFRYCDRPRQNAPSGISMRSLLVSSMILRSLSRRGRTVVVKNRAAASLPA